MSQEENPLAVWRFGWQPAAHRTCLRLARVLEDTSLILSHQNEGKGSGDSVNFARVVNFRTRIEIVIVNSHGKIIKGEVRKIQSGELQHTPKIIRVKQVQTKISASEF